jgi:hypothetical protein
MLAVLAVLPVGPLSCAGSKPRGADAATPGPQASPPREITTPAHCGFGRTDTGARTLQLRAIIPVDWVLVAKGDAQTALEFRPHTRQFWDVECTGEVCEGVLLDLEHVDEDGQIHAIDVSRPSMRIVNGEGSRVVLAWGPYRSLTYDSTTQRLAFAYSASDEEGRGSVECR